MGAAPGTHAPPAPPLPPPAPPPLPPPAPPPLFVHSPLTHLLLSAQSVSTVHE